MIVYDFDVIGKSVSPYEADPPPIIDPNAVFPCSAALQRFEPIPWRGRQIEKLRSIVQLSELTLGNAMNVVWQLFRETAVEKRFGVPVGKGSDHRKLYTRTAF